MARSKSIELFSFNQKHYHIIGIYPEQWYLDGPTFNSRNWIFLIFYIAALSLPSAAFFLFEAKSMLEYGFSFFIASVGSILAFFYIGLIWQMKNTVAFIKNCEQFIAKRTSSAIVYQELIEKIERLCGFIDFAFVMTLIFMTIPFLLYTFINYFVLDLGKESYFLFFLVTWPFDWRTPIGYIPAWCAQFFGAGAVIFSVKIYFNLFFGSCWLFIVMAEDITKDLAAFNKNVTSIENREQWTKSFCDIVQVYSDAKQRVAEFNSTLKYSLLSMLLFLMVSISSMLVTLQFQLLEDDKKPFEIFVELIIAGWVFGLIFFICELGERIALQFDIYHQEFERCKWNTLPIQLQRLYLIFLTDTQQPTYIACYGNVICTRDTFKKIINNGFSYFMTINRV